MKKIFFTILILSVFLFVGCQKTIKVDSIKNGNNFYSAYINYDNRDGIEYAYSILPNKNLLLIEHFPRQTGIERPDSDKKERIENIELKKIEEENGVIKSITIGSYKFIMK